MYVGRLRANVARFVKIAQAAATLYGVWIVTGISIFPPTSSSSSSSSHIHESDNRNVSPGSLLAARKATGTTRGTERKERT